MQSEGMMSPTPATSANHDWRAMVAPYIGPDVRHSIFQLVSTLGLLSVSFVAMYLALSWSWVLAALLLPPTAGLLVRTFIIMHDCAHGSFLPWRKAMEAIGFFTGVLTLTPFGQWRRDHALHHASSGDLDRRGHGDVPMLTVREYLAKTPRERTLYRIVRHPASLLLVGPIHLAVGQRFRKHSKATGTKQLNSVWSTNVALFFLATFVVFAFGWKALLLVYLPAYYLAAMAGVFLFYVQHQFEEAHWETHPDWDYTTAAIQGSSHLRLSPLLQWFTGNIGLHHVHHLAPRIPNYRLQACHDATPALHVAPVVTLRTGIAAFKLSLWDEDQRRMVRFADVDVSAAPVATTAAQIATTG
jgi:acyl-lipid omega-6 desaturase (Delta-12 desaturase)